MLCKLLWAIPGLVGTAIMFAAGVGPDEAVSNLSKWFIKAGVSDVPAWLYPRFADSLAFYLGLAGLVTSAALVFYYKVPIESISNIFTYGHIDGPLRKTAVSMRNMPKSSYDPSKDSHQGYIDMAGGYSDNNPTIQIDFSEDGYPQRYFTWEMETENGKQVNVQRYSMLLTNTSSVDLENVVVKLERVIEEEAESLSSPLGYVLPLETGSLRIRGKDSAWVRLVSYRKEIAPSWISIEGIDLDGASKEGKMFRPDKWRDLFITVRADHGTHLPARFRCWVDAHGCLTMRRLNLDIPNS